MTHEEMQERIDGLEPAQRDGVLELAGGFERVRLALVQCAEAGMRPVDALEHIGIAVPAMVRPLLASQLDALIAG